MKLFVFFFPYKSIILKKLCGNTNSDFPAGAVFCPPSCSGKQHMCPGDSPPERVRLENIPVPRQREGAPLEALNCLLKKCGKKDWGKGTQTYGRHILRQCLTLIMSAQKVLNE